MGFIPRAIGKREFLSLENMIFFVDKKLRYEIEIRYFLSDRLNDSAMKDDLPSN